MSEQPHYQPTIRERYERGEFYEHPPHRCGCAVCNTAAQAALARVRALAGEWERAAAAGVPRNYAASLFATAAKDLRAAIDGEGE